LFGVGWKVLEQATLVQLLSNGDSQVSGLPLVSCPVIAKECNIFNGLIGVNPYYVSITSQY
jgi:hypothetical protein